MGVTLGLYWDTGEENGNYYIIMWYILVLCCDFRGEEWNV